MIKRCAICGRDLPPSPVFTCPWCGSLLPHLPLDSELPDPFNTSRLSVQALKQNHIPVVEQDYLALGGGLGSFAWVEQIAVIGNKTIPYARFQRLCANSQINDQERIRSDSGARPDNLWGWPGYAVEEIADHLGQGRLRDAARIAWQILAEPALADVFTPCAAQVFTSLEREMKRIGWPKMLHLGEICGVYQTNDGRYAAAYQRETPGRTPRLAVIVAPYLHLALGYPGIHLAPETQAYRQATGDAHLVVQAYEEHEHIYRQLTQRGGTIIIRGRGIVSSRILQRLDEIRQATGRNIQIIHLLRSPLTEDTVYGTARRVTRYHMQWQPYNFPKAVFGGDLRAVFSESTPEERQKLVANWGGVTSSDRTDWQEIMARGQKEGWYRVCFGAVEKLQANGRGRVIAHLCTQELNEVEPQPSRLVADFVIDCTGLNTNLKTHAILNDLQERYQLPLNLSGQLAVNDDFELEGLRNGDGRAFMAGVMAFGNHFAPVDSFAGLQYAAQRSVDALRRDDAPGLHPLNGLNSLREWWRWARNLEPLAVSR
jgi:pSer/pThr/pTyr-binding forkhead associated (FHA) protein